MDKPIQFKVYIRKILFTNAIIPVLIITVLAVTLLFGVWSYIAVSTNNSELKYITEQINQVSNSYIELVDKIANSITDTKKLSIKSNQVNILKQVYDLSNESSYRGRLFVFDEYGISVIPEQNNVPDYIGSYSGTNWGIFRLMNQDIYKTQIRIVQQFDQDRAYLLLGKAIILDDKIIGYVIISISNLEFKSTFSKVSSKIIVTDKNDYVYQVDNMEFCDKQNRIVQAFVNNSGRIFINSKHYYFSKSMLFDGDLKIYAIYYLNLQINILLYATLFFVLMLTLLLIFLFKSAKTLANKSTADIDILSNAFEKVQQGNLDFYISIKGSKEFETMGISFNQMLESLKEYIQKNNQMLESVSKAQLRQLESQFHPHFLFNTLENIRVMCKIDPNIASTMIVELSSLMRYSISKANEDITLQEDLQYTNNYLSLLKKRFNRRFSYQLDISPDSLNCYIPKLIIQPLIENSIKYGFGENDALEVKIQTYIQNNCVFIICSDNGAGIEENTLNKLKTILSSTTNNSDHFGLHNVHSRVKLKYGDDYGLSIESKTNLGTKITVTLPISSVLREMI